VLSRKIAHFRQNFWYKRNMPFLHHFASHHFVFFFAPSLLRVFAFKFILVAALPRCVSAVSFLFG